MQNKDTWTLGGHTFTSRFILGSGKYNLNLIRAAVEDAGAEIITLALRRVNTRKEENILDYIPEGVTLLPNTSGARNAEEAVRLARLAREMGCGDFGETGYSSQDAAAGTAFQPHRRDDSAGAFFQPGGPGGGCCWGSAGGVVRSVLF